MVQDKEGLDDAVHDWVWEERYSSAFLSAVEQLMARHSVKAYEESSFLFHMPSEMRLHVERALEQEWRCSGRGHLIRTRVARYAGPGRRLGSEDDARGARVCQKQRNFLK